MNQLFFLEPIQEIIETALFTSCIRDEVPVSMILVGPSGTAKSLLLKRYVSPHIHFTDSFSSTGLYDLARSDPKNELRFIIVPDINPTMSRRLSTVQAATANLLTFTTDGTVRVDDGREVKESKHEPIGFLAAATNDIYDQQAKKWFALGLRRRILPVFYDYSNETTRRLQQLVREDKIRSSMPPKIEMHLDERAHPAIPSDIEEEIEKQSLKLAVLLGKLHRFEKEVTRWYIRKVVPISPQVTLKNLARAHALRARRGQCTIEDVEFIVRFVDFSDPEAPRRI